MSRHLVWTALTIVSGCATIPEGRYGITDIEVHGTEVTGQESLKACLATRPRDDVSIALGPQGDPSCGEAPFDVDRPTLSLWTWSWTDWPDYDSIVFQQDLKRIERWFEARGFHHATVDRVEFDPPSATKSDKVKPDLPCADGDDTCEVEIDIYVTEGQPTVVQSAELAILGELPKACETDLQQAISHFEGTRFDEAH
ncbi:MAG: hypothetical protein KC416_09855, partial [Myxococcales bacterium]|nr:hypothetical protein [Myxococcales bacterium]